MRLIDIDDIFGEKVIMVSQNAYDVVIKLIRMIREAPEVDAVPVVRCKECKHYYADPWGYGNCVFEGGVSRRTKDGDYCSWGERREDEAD